MAAPHRLLDPAAGPLIAVRLNVLTRKTLGGLETDLDGRVLRPGGQPMPGLYAAGEAPGSAAAACTATARWRAPSSAAACSPAGSPAGPPPRRSADRRRLAGGPVLVGLAVRGLVVVGWSYVAWSSASSRAVRSALRSAGRLVLATPSASTQAPAPAMIHQPGRLAAARSLAIAPCEPVLITEPMIATPSAAPTCRLVEATAAATPAWERGMPETAVLVIGALTMPKPTREQRRSWRAASRSWWSRLEPGQQQAARRTSRTPATSSGSRGPRAPTIRPGERRAAASVTTAIGSRNSPACSADSCRTSCR